MSGSDTRGRRRDGALDALRGYAAWLVLAHHFIGVFRPGWIGFPTATPWTGFHLTGTPLMALTNGETVLGFFVVSGYALTLRLFETGQVAGLGVAMVRRWPRLAGPVTITTICFAVLWMTGAFHNREVAALLSSVWMSDLSTIEPLGADSWKPSLQGALAQGAAMTFFRGDSWYNPNLWTMRFELLGSYLSWALALVLTLVLRGRAAWLFLGIVALLLHFCFPHMNAFLAGVVLARAHASGRGIMPARWAMPACVLAVLLMSMRRETLIELMAAGSPVPLPMSLSLYAHVAGSIILIMLFTGGGPWNQVLNNRFGRWVGSMSFAVYLTHPLVLLSASTLAYRQWSGLIDSGAALAAVAALTVALVVAVSIPLAAFDAWWAVSVNKVARRLVQSERVAPEAGAELDDRPGDTTLEQPPHPPLA